MWEPEPPAPAPWQELFDPALAPVMLDRPELDSILGSAHESLPRYFHIDPDTGVAWLAGHDRGEQVFMPDVASALTASRIKVLVIIAGGPFAVAPGPGFDDERGAWLRQLPWHGSLLASAAAQQAGRSPYSALHIRQTDRSLEAPRRATVIAALRTLRDNGPASLFIAADTAAARSEWHSTAMGMGFSPWSAAETEFDRSALAGARSAVIDWLLLSGASAMAYPAASTFSSEAAVASGSISPRLLLRASAGLQRGRRLVGLGRSAVGWPARRLGSR